MGRYVSRWKLCFFLVIVVMMLQMRFIIIELVPGKSSFNFTEPTIRISAKVVEGLGFVSEEEYGNNATLQYTPYHNLCRPPQRLPEYTNLCWPASSKSSESQYQEETGRDTNLLCAPSVYLLGIRKCGTTDVSGWLTHHSLVLSYNSDFDATIGRCAVDQAASRWRQLARERSLPQLFLKKNILFNDAPGQILMHQNLGFSPNKTILNVRSAMQHLSTITDENTKYILTLRDPSARAVSQLIHWQKLKLIRHYRVLEAMTPQIVHKIVLEQIDRVNKCFRKYGPRVCIYLTPPTDGNLDALLLWGLYVEYIEEAFKFIRREQIYIIKLESYSHEETNTMSKVFQFLGLRFSNTAFQQNFHQNKGLPFKPDDRTLPLLRQFYAPFNRRLAKLLDHSKWEFLS